jgi:hypothetical protein
MNKLIWERFKKSTVSKLSNEQLEILIPLLKEEYEARSKRLSGRYKKAGERLFSPED